MHETEQSESIELIANARMQFGALQAIRVLTQGQADSILHLLECDDEALSPPERAFRENIVHYLKKEADFVTVFAEMLQIDENPAPPGTDSQGVAALHALAGEGPRVALLLGYLLFTPGDPMSDVKPPKELDAIVDKVLAYHPKSKTKTMKARKRKTKKIAKNVGRSLSQAPGER